MFKQILILTIIFLSVISVCSADIAFKTRFADHSICYDDSINANHGTYSNIDFDVGIRNGAGVFNGVNSYCTIPHHSSLVFSDGSTDDPFSVSFWINLLEPQKTNPIIHKGYSSSTTSYLISTEGDIPHGNIILYDGISGQTISCVTQDPLIEYPLCNGWLHVTITYDGSSSQTGLNMYFNGVSKACDRYGHPGYICMTQTNCDLIIGREEFPTGLSYLKANLDEVIIYDHEISESEALFIYNSYICQGYTLTLLKNNNLFDKEGNISIYKDDVYVKTVGYGESVILNNTYKYSFVIHEDIKDQLSDINNIDNLTNTGISYLVYTFIIIGIIALLVYFYRRF